MSAVNLINLIFMKRPAVTPTVQLRIPGKHARCAPDLWSSSSWNRTFVCIPTRCPASSVMRTTGPPDVLQLGSAVCTQYGWHRAIDAAKHSPCFVMHALGQECLPTTAPRVTCRVGDQRGGASQEQLAESLIGQLGAIHSH